jgi:DNA repair protein SbcD/Mre11
VKLLHCADIHIGYETHGRLDPESGLNTRLIDFRRCFDVMVERALEEKVDVFLFCGDAYRTPDPTPTQQKLFAEALAPIARAGIPIVMIVGNHDHPVSFGKASSVDIFPYLQGDVHVYRRPTFETIPTLAGPLQLIALPWPVRSVILSREEHRRRSPVEIREFIEELYARFVRNSAAALDPAVPAVVAAHIAVQGADPGGSERTSLIAHEPRLTVEQLAQPGVDYVALGHIHKFQELNREAVERGDGPPVVYSSSIERISFKEHDAEKGFVVVEIEADAGAKATRYEFVPTPARSFVPIEVDVRGKEDPTAEIVAAIDPEKVAGAVVRVRYRVTESESALVDMGEIRDALRGAECVAAIERAVDPVERRRTTLVRRETTLADALGLYVDQHENLSSIRDDLVRTALEIESELD